MKIKESLANILISVYYKHSYKNNSFNCIRIACIVFICISILMTCIDISLIIFCHSEQSKLNSLQFRLNQTKVERHEILIIRNRAYSINTELFKENELKRAELDEINFAYGNSKVIYTIKNNTITYYQDKLTRFNNKINEIESLKDIFKEINNLNNQIKLLHKKINLIISLNEID